MSPNKPAKVQENASWLYPALTGAAVLFLALVFVKDDNTTNVLQMVVAGAATAVIGWGIALVKQGRGKDFQILRDRLLLTLGLAGALGYCNFGHLHFGNFIHVWDTYHYYMGAKYFPEVNYDLLYDCAVVADVEAGLKDQALGRAVTDLRTNVMVKTDELVAHPEICKSHFSPARWDEYKKDLNFFRSRVNQQRWKEIHHDHGYNATPVWTIAGYLLSNLGPATEVQVVALNLLDPIYLILTGVLLWWAFGMRVFAVGMITLGCNFANRYYWTGGAFLRHDWVFYTVAVVCLLKKERFFMAGLALAYAALLRLFPGLMVVGPVLAGLEYLRLNKKLDPKLIRFVAGGAVGTLVLLAASLNVGGKVSGLETWQHFAKNTAKHANTPLTNHMGLRTLVSYRPSTIGQQMRDGSQIDAWKGWKDTRLVKFHEAKPVFFLGIFASLVLLYLAIRHSGTDLWFAASMGVGFIVIGAELTNYYYCFMMAGAALMAKRREAGLLITLCAVVSQFVHLAPLPGMGQWEDEQYVALTVTWLIMVLALWFLFTEWAQKDLVEPEGPAQGVPDFAFAGSADSKKKR